MPAFPFKRWLLAGAIGFSGVTMLWAAEPPAPPASTQLLDLLNEALGYEKEEVQAAALRAYGSLGPRALPGLPVLAEKIRTSATLKDALPFAQAFLCLGDEALSEVKKMADAKETKPLMALAKASTLVRTAPSILKVLAEYPETDVSLPVKDRVSVKDVKAPGYIKAGAGHDSKTRLATMQGLYGDRLTEDYRDYLLAALNDPYEEVRELAARKLGDLNARTPQTVEALGRAYLEGTEDNTRFAAAQSLAKMGAPALPWLIKGLEDPNDSVRRWGLYVIGKLGDAASEALPLLRQLAESEKGDTRVHAIRAIADITGDRQSAIDRYMQLLCQNEAIKALDAQGLAQMNKGHRGRPPEFDASTILKRERSGALKELCEIGAPVADRVLPILRETILTSDTSKHGIDGFAKECLQVLPRFGTVAAPLLIEIYLRPDCMLDARNTVSFANENRAELLLEFARHADAKAQLFAAKELCQRGGPLNQEVAVAAAALQSPDPAVRVQALQSLAQRNAPDTAALASPVLALVKDPDAEIQKLATDLVRRHKLQAGGAVPGLTAGLGAADAQTRLNTALSLARQGQCPEAAVSVLDTALRGGKLSPEDQQTALKGLRAAGRKSPGVRTTIVACAKDPKATQETVDAAIGALAVWEPEANRERLLVQFLADQNWKMATAAARELGRGGDNVLPRLLQLAQNPQTTPAARVALREAFVIIGPTSIPGLLELLWKPECRRLACSALPAFGAGTVAKVVPLLNSTDEGVVNAALDILEQTKSDLSSAVPALIKICAGGSNRLREQALGLWARTQPGEPAVRDAVMKALDSDDHRLRMAAAHVAAGLKLDLQKALPRFAAGLRSATTATEQIEIVGVLGTVGEAALPYLEPALLSKYEEVRRSAWQCGAWQSLGALPILAKLIQCPVAEARVKAAEQLQSHKPLSIILFRAALKNPDPEIRKLAVDGLKKIGWLAKPVLDAQP